MTPPRRRVLLCLDEAPWREAGGYHLRLAMMAEGLAQVGQLDMCMLRSVRPPEVGVTPPAPICELEWLRVESSPGWARDAALGRVAPVWNHLLSADSLAAARARFFSGRYDLTWCEDANGYQPVAALVSHPVVLDLHNVHTPGPGSKQTGLRGRLPTTAELRDLRHGRVAAPLLRRRWNEWYERAGAAVDGVTVCSSVEADRLDVSADVTVIPNCYPVPCPPAGRDHVESTTLRIGFIGLFRYPPNVEGVQWFVENVLDEVLRHQPSAELRVIGEASEQLTGLGSRPGVKLLGYIADLSRALREIDVLIAPLHFGGGTRFKVIEAFAHRIPMVSTTFGAEGIGARHLAHLVIADDAASFAQAIIRLAADDALRTKLVDAAERLYRQRYTWDLGVDTVASLADDLMTAWHP